MSTAQSAYLTKSELVEALATALKPIKDDIALIKKRTNQMYDALAKEGLPMPPKDGDNGD